MCPVSVSGLAAFAELVVFSSRTTVCPPSGTKTLRKRCVYNHGNSYLFRFTYTYMQITVHRLDFVGDKNVDVEFPDACLFGHPFYFGYQDFKS